MGESQSYTSILDGLSYIDVRPLGEEQKLPHARFHSYHRTLILGVSGRAGVQSRLTLTLTLALRVGD